MALYKFRIIIIIIIIIIETPSKCSLQNGVSLITQLHYKQNAV